MEIRLSYLHKGISYTGKMSSLYWIRALISLFTLSNACFTYCCPEQFCVLSQVPGVCHRRTAAKGWDNIERYQQPGNCHGLCQRPPQSSAGQYPCQRAAGWWNMEVKNDWFKKSYWEVKMEKTARKTRTMFETPKYPRRPRNQYTAQIVNTLELIECSPTKSRLKKTSSTL